MAKLIPKMGRRMPQERLVIPSKTVEKLLLKREKPSQKIRQIGLTTKPTQNYPTDLDDTEWEKIVLYLPN